MIQPRHRRRYGHTLAATTVAALGLVTLLLAFGPAPSVRPYELRGAREAPWAANPPVRLLTVDVVDGNGVQVEPEGPLPDLEPDARLELAAAPTPARGLARPRHASPRYEFMPISNRQIATQALFRMEPVLDALPAGLRLDRVVVVKVRVSDDGKVVEAKVAKGLDHTHDQQALQAAWLYELPGEKKGERPDWVTLPYEFLDRP